MKRLAMSIVLVLGGCGAEEAPEVAAAGESATVEVELPAMAGPAPEHGGTVLMAGQRAIEVVADEAGAIEAFFLGEAAAAPQDARITVRVPDREGQVRPVVLTWDPAASRYQGTLRGAQPVPGPIELVLVLGSETLRGRAPTYVIEAARALQPAVPVEAAAGVVRAAGPATAVVVEPPQPPNVVVQAPATPPPPTIAPPPTIVVQQPAPSNARVVVAAPPAPPPPVLVAAPPQPNARVVVAAPPPPRVVAAQPPPANARVVAAQPPPANARVVAAQPPAARVVASPPPAPAVRARPPRPSPPGRAVGRDREDDDDDRGRGRGRDDD